MSSTTENEIVNLTFPYGFVSRLLSFFTMETNEIDQVVIIPASPQEVYHALTDPEIHGLFTNTDVTGVAIVGGKLDAGSGYIQGKYLELIENKKIIMEWGTEDFPEEAPPSILTLTFSPHKDGTELHLTQVNTPPGQTEMYDQGWWDYYWLPLIEYFESHG